MVQFFVDAFHKSETRTYKIVHGVVWFLIVMSIGLFVVELQFGDASWRTGWLAWLDWGILVVFAIELVLRVLTFVPAGSHLYARSPLGTVWFHIWGRLLYLIRPMNLIDLLAVLAVSQQLRGLRALRLLRLLRSARLFKYSSPIAGITQAFRDNAFLYWMAFSFFGLVTTVGGLSIYLIEVEHNPAIDTIGDGIWWGLVTITTVGFGDIAPVTVMGRFVGGFLMIMGMFALACFAGIVANTLLNAILSVRVEQFRMSQYVNHVVVCGYDEGSRMLLDTLSDELAGSDSQVVVFGVGTRPPSLPSEVIWIPGDPKKESELDKVRLVAARAVIVIGQRQLSPGQADALSILTVFTMRSYLKKQPQNVRRTHPVYIVAEVLDGENVEHARTAGASEVIESTKIGFSMLAHAICVPGASEIMSRVVVAGAHNLYVDSVPNAVTLPMTFGEMGSHIKQHWDVLLIGIRIGEEDILNPPDETHIGNHCKLIYLGEGPKLQGPSLTIEANA